MEELVLRPVVRKHIDSEWMSKMSAKEFRAWEEAERMTMIICKYPTYEHDARHLQAIEFKEMEYKLRKEQIEEHQKKNKKLDESITNKLKMVYDLVGVPGNPDAVINEPNKNGRIYRKNKYTPIGYEKAEKEYYDGLAEGKADWMLGELNHPNVVRWDKYEKHVKKHGI